MQSSTLVDVAEQKPALRKNKAGVCSLQQESCNYSKLNPDLTLFSVCIRYWDLGSHFSVHRALQNLPLWDPSEAGKEKDSLPFCEK